MLLLLAQTAIILFLLMFALVQKSEADKQFRRAEAERIQAEKNAEAAMKLLQELEKTR